MRRRAVSSKVGPDHTTDSERGDTLCVQIGPPPQGVPGRDNVTRKALNWKGVVSTVLVVALAVGGVAVAPTAAADGCMTPVTTSPDSMSDFDQQVARARLVVGCLNHPLPTDGSVAYMESYDSCGSDDWGIFYCLVMYHASATLAPITLNVYVEGQVDHSIIVYAVSPNPTHDMTRVHWSQMPPCAIAYDTHGNFLDERCGFN